MKFLKVLGWLFVPYIMILVQWRKLGGSAKVLGSVWAVIALVAVFNGNSTKNQPTTTTTATTITTAAPEKPSEQSTSQPQQQSTATQTSNTTAASNSASTPAEPATEKQDEIETVLSGENGFLKDDVFVAKNEDAEDEMYKYINANNKDALIRMAARGDIFLAKKNTPITVIDRGFLTATIEIIETGQRGLVPVEFLSKKEQK